MSDMNTRCAYCGAPLDSTLYFCVKCGKPYADFALTAERNTPRYTAYAIRQERIRKTLNFYWLFFGVLIIVSILRDILELGNNNIGILFITYTVLIIFSGLFIKLNKMQISYFFIWRKKTSRLLTLSVFMLVPMLFINFGYHHLLRYLVEQTVFSFQIHDLYPYGYPSLLLNIFIICILPAIIEEIIFRGIIQTNLESVTSINNAVMITAALFSLVHFSVLSFPYLFLLGFFLGWIKIKSGSLWVPILIHFLHNLAVIVFF